MHGCGGLDAVATKWATMWTRALAAWGIGTLTLDSFTTRGVKATCGPPDAHWSRRRVDDAYSALEFLAARRDLKADKVYMMGRSNGGRAVLNALQVDYRTIRTRFFAGGISLYPSCVFRKNDSFYAPLLLLIASLDDANLPANTVEACIAAHTRQPDHGRPGKSCGHTRCLSWFLKVGGGRLSGCSTTGGWAGQCRCGAHGDAKRPKLREFLARHGAGGS